MKSVLFNLRLSNKKYYFKDNISASIISSVKERKKIGAIGQVDGLI